MRTQEVRARGFTLIELLVVMAIIGIIAGFILAAVRKVPQQTRIVECRELLGQVETVWKTYLMDNREFPPEPISEMDTNAMNYVTDMMDFTTNELATNSAVAGLRDPWGEVIRLDFDTDFDGKVVTPYGEVDKKIAVWSKGPDKIEGSGDDIKSW